MQRIQHSICWLCTWVMLMGISLLHAQWEVIPVMDVSQKQYNALELLDSNVIFIGGGGADVSSGFILRSVDGGSSWKKMKFLDGGTVSDVKRIFFPESPTNDVGYAIAAVLNEGYKLFKTENGGAYWSVINFGDNPRGYEIHDVYFRDENLGWFTVRYGYSPQISIFKTTDGGDSWTEVPSPPGISYARFITAASDSELFVAASDSFQHAVMLHTTDAGDSWQEIRTGAFDIVKPIYAENQIFAIARDSTSWVDYNVVIGTRTDSLWTWEKATEIPGTPEDIQVIYPHIYVTTNHFNGTQNVGLFYHSPDTGRTWEIVELPFPYHLNRMRFLDPSFAYAIGDSGYGNPRLFKTTNAGGLVAIDAPAPTQARTIRLEQNYPNPFNPATTIAFELPTAARVQLAIFDITGRQIRTLANRSFPAGRHTLIWDGRDSQGHPVASGVYFYRFTSVPGGGQSPGVTLTRKMMLIR
ncbi:MAG: T9SS type A sorting domain-containing protein [Calditrichaeota bacterium]|nr:T9SS type A sorting domain-containing protein [Calditrichota bacterium]